MTFDEAFDILMEHEGGYSNHPSKILTHLEKAIEDKQSVLAWDRAVTNGCTVDKCGRQPVGHGLCNTHYLRKQKGMDLLKPIKNRKRGAECLVCSDKVDGKGGWGLCRKHYKQERNTLIKDALIELFGDR